MNLRKLLVASVALMTLGVASAQTAVTPATGGAPNPFAYGLSSTVENGVINISYSLNATASSASVIVKNSAGQAVITQTLSGLTKGAHTISVDLSGQPSDTYTWEIKVTGAAQTAVTEFKLLKFYHPSGLDVDNSMESPSFGTLFIAEGYTKGKTSGYVSAQADGSDGGGLYMYTAGGDQILNKDGKPRFYGSTLKHSNTFAENIGYGADFARVAVAEDGRIFVTRHNDSGDFILSAKSVEDLQNGGDFTSLVEGKTMTDTKYYTDANGNFLVGPNQGFDVKGSGANTKMIALSCANNSAAMAYSNNRTMEYNIGTSNTLPTGTAVAALDKKYTIAYDRSVNVAYDNRGGIWYCQSRQTPTDAQPSLAYVDANGTIQHFEGAGFVARRRGAIAVSPDGTRLAASSAYGQQFSIYDINYAEDGAVSLTETHRITVAGNNLYSLAWDVAGNVYAGNATSEYVKGFAIPRTSNDFTTKAASKYAVKYEAGPVVPTVTPGAGDANAYAYALSSTVENGVININYSLNADATAAELVVKNSAGEAVITQSLTGVTKGAHAATVSLEGQETDTYTWEIKVIGAAQAEVKEFAAYKFNHPRGVDVDNNIESATFGNVYVTEGQSSTDTKFWSVTGGGIGLYAFSADMQPITNPATGNYAFTGGLTLDPLVVGPENKNTNGADFCRVRIDKTGKIYVTRQNDNGNYLYAADASTLLNENKLTAVFTGGSLDATTYAYNDASSNFIAAPNQGFDIKGEGKDFKMVMISGQKNIFPDSYKANATRVDEYALGTATTWNSTPTPISALSGKYVASYSSVNVTYDNRGGIWFSQYRGAPTDALPALVYVDANGDEKYKDVINVRGGGGFRFNPDFTQVAIASSKTTFSIYDITYSSDNTPTLTEVYKVAHGIGTNVNDIAWDLAGNIYICGNIGEYLKGFSLPRENNEFTTTASAKYAVSYEAPAPVAPLYIVGNSEEVAKWDPNNAAEFEFDGENYVITLSEVTTEFKISTSRGDWGKFNAGNLAVDAALTNGGTVNLSVNKDGQNIVLPWAGVWTITVAGDLSTLTASTTTPEPAPVYPAAVYMIGHDNAWDIASPLEIIGENGVYTATVDFTSTKFKLSTTKGDGDWTVFNATGLNVVSNPIAIGEPVALIAGYSEDINITNTGIYEVTIDLVNNTLTLEVVVNYPEVIYAIGNINGLDWSTSEGVAFSQESEGIYKGTIDVDNVDAGYGYFQFATTLGADWGAVNAGTRYGATEENQLVDANVTYNMTNNWGGGTKSWKCAAGKCTIEVDLTNNTMKIVEFTGVEGIVVDDNASAEYYNLQGVKVENPTNGTFIKVQGNKTTKVVIK